MRFVSPSPAVPVRVGLLTRGSTFENLAQATPQTPTPSRNRGFGVLRCASTGCGLSGDPIVNGNIERKPR